MERLYILSILFPSISLGRFGLRIHNNLFEDIGMKVSSFTSNVNTFAPISTIILFYFSFIQLLCCEIIQGEYT